MLLTQSLSDFTSEEAKALESFLRAGGTIITGDKPDWLAKVQAAIENPSLSFQAPSSVRAILCDQSNRSIIHLLNLNIQRLSSFEDKITPAKDLKIVVSKIL